MGLIESLIGYLSPGAFLYFDLLAVFTNALNGALFSLRPDNYQGNYITVVGILVFAAIGDLSGGITQDVLLNKQPQSLTNPWFIILVIASPRCSRLVVNRQAGTRIA